MSVQLSDSQIKKNVFEKIQEYKILKAKVKNFENCLTVLDPIEREIIERKLLSNSPDIDISVYMDIGIKKEKFYKKKQSAQLKLAKVLGIIKPT